MHIENNKWWAVQAACHLCFFGAGEKGNLLHNLWRLPMLRMPYGINCSISQGSALDPEKARLFNPLSLCVRVSGRLRHLGPLFTSVATFFDRIILWKTNPIVPF
jgi:hypothetical protein